ncbi:hypothetical protein [Cellulomonas sp. Root137]|uniref:hypothetical protein n=1 Tax=Cellulomonas sp. Root137 TaxID=1736459 RepID=UPI0006FED5E7|nr:hypothetical protein [Cellulomonas sp. Root137]KQY46459.1 hypothetical protein ASD18_03190 [Cellulomonas sp. Root137]
MLFVITCWVLLPVGVVLGVRALRRCAQAERRLWGRRPMSLGEELRWLLVLLIPWGLFLALGAYAIDKNCVEDSFSMELAPGTTVAEHCSGVLREQFPGTLIAVTTFFASVALLWTAVVLVVRARERRRSSIS